MTGKVFVAVIVVLTSLLAAGSLFAHHAFAPIFDADRVVRLKGVVTRFEWGNPHAFIYVDTVGADGAAEQWALEGPSVQNLTRRGYSPTSVKPGETVEVCGYAARDGALEIGSDSGLPSRIMNVELLTMADGETHLWQDYGQRKCRDAQ
jgi:hypothetical protein